MDATMTRRAAMDATIRSSIRHTMEDTNLVRSVVVEFYYCHEGGGREKRGGTEGGMGWEAGDSLG